MDTARNGSNQSTGPEWYALHTRARHEKAIAARLGEQSTEVYLPLHRRRKKWRNGVHAEVDFPLLPCYLFARVTANERARLLAIKGVLGFAEAEVIAPAEIDRLRTAAQLKAVPHPPPDGGDKVRVITGPLAGAEGILEKSDGSCHVVLNFPPMRRAIAVPVPQEEVEPLQG